MKLFKNKFLYFYLAVGIVLYVYIHFVIASLNPPLPKPDQPPRLYSNACDTNIRLSLIHALKSAKKNIHLVMFGLSEPSILRTLTSQCEKNGIHSTVFYDPTATPMLSNKIETMQARPIYSRGLMHQKILVVDDQVSFLGSANMTRASVEMHDNLIVGINSSKIAHFLKSKTPRSSGHLKTMVGGQDVEIWLLPDPRGHALTAIRSLIRNAKTSLKLAMFTFTHPLLLDEIINAKNRGIQVSAIVDYNSGLGSSSKVVKLLRKNGVDVVLSSGPKLMHNKFLIIDDQHLVLGSANWTKSAFYKNHDCFVVLHNLNANQRAFMTKLWSRIKK